MTIFEQEYLIKALMREHLVKHKIFYIFDYMPFRTNNRLLGRCCYANKMLLFNTNFMYNSLKDDARKVILHEIAHVLAGSKAKHGKWFQKKCKEIGLTDEKYMGLDNVK